MRPYLPALALLLAFAAPAGAQDRETIPSLSVSGEGVVMAEPDMAMVTLGVVSRGKTAREALDANNTDMADTIAAIREAGVADKDIGTTGFDINPVYSERPQRPQPDSEPFEPKIIAYQVRNQVSVRIRDIDKSGAVLDGVVSAGANSVNGISFDIAEPAKLADEATRNAIADARRKAEMIAEAAGVRLVRILSISTGRSGPQPMRFEARVAAAPQADVPIMQGERSLTAQATIVYEIAPR